MQAGNGRCKRICAPPSISGASLKCVRSRGSYVCNMDRIILDLQKVERNETWPWHAITAIAVTHTECPGWVEECWTLEKKWWQCCTYLELKMPCDSPWFTMIDLLLLDASGLKASLPHLVWATWGHRFWQSTQILFTWHPNRHSGRQNPCCTWTISCLNT